MRFLIILLSIFGFAYAQGVLNSQNDKVIILGKDVYYGKFYFFKKQPIKMLSLPGDFVLKIDSSKCPLGFTLGERKYIQGFYDIKLVDVERENNCITYIGNIPERKVIKDMTIGQIILTYCEMDDKLDCDKGVITWQLYYFPQQQ